MRVLFAVSKEEISEAIINKYRDEYKQIISYKNVYYFNAIIKELQKDKNYDRIVISEDLEAFTNTQYDQIDKFVFEKLDNISDEASNSKGNDIPIILICSDRRTKSEEILVKLFGIGVYNAIIGNDRSIEEVCKLINRPRAKKEAKTYYKIDSEDVNYQAETENDVSEMEIQNIIAHYKRLGKNEDKYVNSFDNIAAQYNDTQLRIISKFLPLNVRAVLEERSPKYQQIMSFNNSVSNNLRVKKQTEDNGPTEVLLKPKQRERIMSNPVVIPSSVNMAGTKKLSRPKQNKEIINTQPEEKVFVSKNPEDIVNRAQREHIEEKNFEEPEVKEPIKRRRGRPRKEVTPPVEIEEKPVKRGRGRPRKNPISEKPKEEYIQETILPGFEDDIEEEPTNVSQNGPQFDNYENENKNIVEENTFLPGFNDVEENDDNEEYIDYNRNENYNDDDNNKVDEYENKDNYENFENNYDNNNYNNYNNYDNYNRNETVINPIIERNEEQYEEVDLSNLLTPDKKLVTFLGTSKNGTSFIVNNIAELMSSIGVDTAILDTTQNKNSYYIYTKNEEELRKVASKSIENLSIGEANGIKVHRNLTVYTSLPNELGAMNEADKILETLLKNHSLVLIDSDFDTPLRYFKQSQEIYLVQSMDILTIQPLTKFLRELKSKNILEERKLRIILNKNEKVRGIKNETIIGGMAFYNDPAMSYMTELFDRNMIKYITIPFDEEVYVNYLEALINCEISLRGYSKPFIQRLRELGNMIYPMVVMSTPDGGRRNRMKPNKANQQYQSYNNDAFSSNMNDTLNRMKNSF